MVWRFNNPPPPTEPTGQASDLKFDMQGPQVIRFWATEAIFDMLPQAWDLGWADMKGRVTLAPPGSPALGQHIKNRLGGPKSIHYPALHIKFQRSIMIRLSCG